MSKNLVVFGLFFILAIILRFYAFFYSATGWDESLYLLMARSLLEGHPLYTEIWDNKPPGIYLLFAFALTILGNSVISIRILACLAITTTCYLLYKLGNKISRDYKNLGLLAGALYVIFTLTSSGIEANTELFYTPFVTLAFYLLFKSKVYSERLFERNDFRFILIGLLIGIGWQIKPVVVFDFSAIFLITGIKIQLRNTSGIKSLLIKTVKYYALLLIGFILPATIIVLYFVSLGMFAEYIYANFTANVIRSSVDQFSLTRLFSALGKQVISNFIFWYCLVAAPIYLLLFRSIRPQEKKNLLFLLIWFCLDFPAVLYTKAFYNYYFLQLFPSQCLLSAYIILKTLDLRKELTSQKHRLVFFPILIGILFSFYPIVQTFYKSTRFIYFRYAKGVSNWGDPPAMISEYIRNRINKGDYIYVVDYQPIIYFLTQAKVPTKYGGVPSFLLGSFAKFAASEPLKELDKIMTENQPIYVVKKIQEVDVFNQEYYAHLDNYLNKNYILETSIDEVNLYRLKTISRHSSAD